MSMSCFSKCRELAPYYKENEMQKMIQGFANVYEEPKVLPPMWYIQHEIQLLLDSSFPNIALYRQSILEQEDIKR